jgi:hypothetical protein
VASAILFSFKRSRVCCKRVAFGRALRDRSDRRADGLLRARPSHWIFSQQQFDQSVLRG